MNKTKPWENLDPLAAFKTCEIPNFFKSLLFNAYIKLKLLSWADKFNNLLTISLPPKNKFGNISSYGFN